MIFTFKCCITQVICEKLKLSNCSTSLLSVLAVNNHAVIIKFDVKVQTANDQSGLLVIVSLKMYIYDFSLASFPFSNILVDVAHLFIKQEPL